MLLNAKILLFTTLLLSADVFATTKIDYTAKYHDGKNVKQLTVKDEIPDKKAPNIVKGMVKWSQDKFKAVQDQKTKIVHVITVQITESEKKAQEVIKDMKEVIKKHLKDGKE